MDDDVDRIGGPHQRSGELGAGGSAPRLVEHPRYGPPSHRRADGLVPLEVDWERLLESLATPVSELGIPDGDVSPPACQALARTRDLSVMAQEPARLVVEKRRSGCGTWLAVMILLGLAIKYWYISLAIAALVIAFALARAARPRELARHMPGPRDPWLNEVAVALADLGLTERARNTGPQLGGAPLEGDIGLHDDRFAVFVNLFATNELARQAEMGLRANPRIQNAMSKGHTVVKTDGRIVYVATGRGHVVDDFRLDEVIRLVGPISVPPPRQTVSAATPSAAGAHNAPSVAQLGATVPDPLGQLTKLGDLHRAKVLTDGEFEAKKAEVLRRI